MQLNSTFSDVEDPFLEPDLEENNVRYYPNTIDIVWQIFTGLTNFFASVGSAIASGLLIYIMIKFNKLQKTNQSYILHYAIWSLINFIATPIMEILYMLFLSSMLGSGILCIGWQFETASCIGFMMFIFALGLDWYLLVTEKIKEKYDLYKLWVTIGIYVICILQSILLVLHCKGVTHSISGEILTSIYSILLVGIILINVLVSRTQLNQEQIRFKHLLTISTIVLSSYTPLLVLSIIYQFEEYADISTGIIYILEFIRPICEIFAHSSPIIVTVLLCKYDKHFKMAYDLTCKCSRKAYQQGELDEEDVVVDEFEHNGDHSAIRD